MQKLLKDIQKGDELAFKQLTEKYANDLYKIARTRLKNEEDIKDAIQNTMIITYNSIKKIKKLDAFKTWIFRVLINECNKVYNENKKRQTIFEKASKENKDNMYDYSIQTSQSQIDFETLIKKLDYDEEIVMILYYSSQMTIKEISKVLKINENTIKSRLTRGKTKLKKICEEEKNYD